LVQEIASITEIHEKNRESGAAILAVYFAALKAEIKAILSLFRPASRPAQIRLG
jgi:hypothetical protein